MARRKCVDCGNWVAANKSGSKKFPRHLGGCPIDARRAAAAHARDERAEAEAHLNAATYRAHKAAVLRGDLLA